MSERDAQQLDVAYVARLARLELTPEEIQRLQGQLDHVLEHVRRLSALDVSNVEPTAYNALHQGATLREDITRPPMNHDDAMRNAPAHGDGLFSVPPIIE